MTKPKPDHQPGEESEEDVPRIPRGRFFTRMAVADLVRIGMFAALLVLVLAVREPCAGGTAQFFETLSAVPPDAGAGEELELRRLTEEEIREAFGGTLPGEDAGATGEPDRAPRHRQ